MGITGLIPFLEKATRKVTLKDLKGSTVGVDTYCWLHKGAISCAEKLIRGDVTDMHINYCLKYVNLLLSNGIKPVLVFDGRHLPAKALTERRRGASRKEAKEKAKELMREGKMNEARSYINRSVNITHDMAHQLIVKCRERNVDCIVAPFEADGQLAYLSRQKIIDYVITEDSDLTLFGCSKVIFKFDLTGQGLLYEAEHLPLAMGCKPDKFEFRRFEMMAVLSGCDYLDSLKGVGLVKACKFVLMTEETDVRRCLKKIPQYLNLKGVTVEDEYIEGFLRAIFTFRHMIVYDPTTKKQVHLTEPADEDLPFCDNAGEKLPDEEIAFQLAIGNVNPFTMKQIDKWDPSELNTDKYPSIWGQGGGGAGSGGAKKSTNSCIITVNKPSAPSSANKRKILKPVEDDDEGLDNSMNTSVDILNKYLDHPKEELEPPSARIDSPSNAKKIRLSTDNDPPSRNPFLKKPNGHSGDSCTDDDEDKKPSRSSKNPFLSKAKKAKEEDEKPHFSLLQQANAIKTEHNTSRFKKVSVETVAKKVNVVSRFFSPGGSGSVENKAGQVEESPAKKDVVDEKQEWKGNKSDQEYKLEEMEGIAPLMNSPEKSTESSEVSKEPEPGPSTTATEETSASKEKEDPVVEEIFPSSVPAEQSTSSPSKPKEDPVPDTPTASQEPSKSSQQPDIDSEGTDSGMDCSAFVETQYSDSDMQRDNEQSPVPWLAGSSSFGQENLVQDTLPSSEVISSNKENNQDMNNNVDCILVLSDDNGTPLKIKTPVKKRSMPSKNAKQPTMMSFFKKKSG